MISVWVQKNRQKPLLTRNKLPMTTDLKTINFASETSDEELKCHFSLLLHNVTSLSGVNIIYFAEARKEAKLSTWRKFTE
eukprot:g65389.t1